MKPVGPGVQKLECAPALHAASPLRRTRRGLTSVSWSQSMQNLVEDFLQYLRNERGHAENTQKTYAALLGKFVAWARSQGLSDWRAVQGRHLLAFLQQERRRALTGGKGDPKRRLSTESLYLEIAALRAFYRFAENEKLLPLNVAESLSLPRRWRRLPKALDDAEITQLLKPHL